MNNMANVHCVRKAFCFEEKKYTFQNWIICKCIEECVQHSSCKNDSKALFFFTLFLILLLVFRRWLDCWVMPTKKFHVCLMKRHNMTMSCISKIQRSNLIQLTECWNLIVWEIESSDKNVWQPYFIARASTVCARPRWIFKWWLMMNIWLIDSILIWSSLLVIRL